MIDVEEPVTRVTSHEAMMCRYADILSRLPRCPLNKRIRDLMADADRLADDLEAVLAELRPQSLARSRTPLAAFLRSFDQPDLVPSLTAAAVCLRFAMGEIVSTLPPVEPGRAKSR